MNIANSLNLKSKRICLQKGNFLLGLSIHEGQIYAHQSNRGLMRIGKDSLGLLSDFYQKKVFRAILPLSKDTLLIPTRTEGLFLYHLPDSSSTNFKIEQSNFLVDNNIYSASLLPFERIGLGIVNQWFILLSKQGKTLQSTDESRLLQSDDVLTIFPSFDHNLWLGLANGFSRIEESLAWGYWDKNAGLKGWVNDILRFVNRLYVATDNHVYYLENNQPKEVKGIPSGTCWDFVEYTSSDKQKNLLVGTSTGLYHIKGDQAILIRQGNHAIKVLISKLNPNRLYLMDGIKLLSMIYQNNQWKEEGAWQGKALIATKKGLYLHNPKNDRFEPYCDLDSSLCDPQKAVFLIQESSPNRIWALPRSNKNHDLGYFQAKPKGGYDWVYKPFRRLPQMEFGCVYEENGVFWL